MTRLDATSEPSMEDILASIRKIIAEDPPGSRPALTPSAPSALQSQNPAVQQPLRAPERDPFATFARRNDDAISQPMTSPSPEPYLKSSPAKPAASDYGNEPFFAPRSSTSPSSFDATAAAPSRIEPSFGPISGDGAPTADVVDDIASPAAGLATGVSVDAQLSDLLGEAASVAIQPTPAAPGRAALFGDRMAGRMAQSSIASPSAAAVPMSAAPAAGETIATVQLPDARPGFTVSRDGFVGPSEDAASSSDAPAEADPFEFDLGPSPFLAKPEAPVANSFSAPTGNSLTARMSASSLERIAAPSVAATVATGGAIDDHNEAGQVSETAASPHEQTAPQMADMPAVEIAAPSVAATLAPKPFEAPRAAEPVGRFIPANASVETPKPVDRDVLEVVAPQYALSETATIEIVRVAPEAEPQDTASSTSSSSTAIAVHHADGQMRTMEETVAELLRPMLKTWLAENMPRIVERALRRELTEQMLLDKKHAAE